MPVYEYVCGRCGEVFELLVGLSERDVARECPHCGSSEVKRRLSSFTTGGSRTSLDPGTFVKEKGRPVRHVKPPGS
ncbi:MAG: zinc ribbon domain-containing protein [Thermoleophilia bacterium]